MIVSVVGLVVLAAVVVAVAGGFVLRAVGRIAVVLGLLGAAVEGDLLGLLVAAIGYGLIVAGRSRALDRRRRQA